jgi:hypothetical protein
MLHRYVYIEKDRPLADSGEHVSQVNITDPITALWVEVRATNGATDNVDNRMHACVSKVELIDGSDVLYSADARQGVAMNAYDLGWMPHQRLTELGGDPASAEFAMMFGRFIGDQVYAFDPSKHMNPQVRVTWNLAAVRAVAATAYATGTGRLTIIAEVMEGAPAPTGFLQRKEYYTWTSAVGTEYIDLPVQYPLRTLLFRGHLTAYHPYDVISNLKVTANAGQYTPIDVGVEDLIYLQMQRYPKFHYRESMHKANGDTYYSMLEELENVMLISEQTVDCVLGYNNYEYGSQTIQVYTAGSADTNKRNIGVMCDGWCPFGYVQIPFGDPWTPSDWFPTPDFRSLRVEAQGAVASGECALVLVQDRAYT